jgi:hypothetical protein
MRRRRAGRPAAERGPDGPIACAGEPTRMRAMRALVIGCGIGGASVALALAEIGFDVEVYETTPRARDDHGWVTLGPRR